MPLNPTYAPSEPARSDVDQLAGPTLLEFGSPTCPHCRRIQPLLASAFGSHAGVRHIKVEDGKGRPLGRSYGVKLWPTLIFLNDGQEVERLVRPPAVEVISDAMALIDPLET